MENIKRIDIKEFRELGFLQELNRQFLHPLGLSLEVIIEEDGSEKLGGVWDYRDDLEGMFFDPEHISQKKIDYVEALRQPKVETRISKQKEYNVKVNNNGVQVI